MPNIFVFTCSSPQAQLNFKKTIEDGIRPEMFFSYLSEVPKTVDLLKKEYPEGRYYLWGAQEKKGPNRKTWEKMEPGDLILGYQDKSIVSAARLVGKIDNPAMAKIVWGQDEDEPFRLIYFLTKPTLCKVPIIELAEYFPAKFQGFTRIKPKNTKIPVGYTSFDNFIEARLKGNQTPIPKPTKSHPTPTPGDPMKQLIQWISSQGFFFEPWQIACYATALRTKPFVILAGVSGTGKSKLPALVAEATGGTSRVIPVRPDWTDSAEVIGYSDLQGRFRPGQLLQYIAESQKPENREIQHVGIIDEMNLARVEHYFAEVLSRIEDREKYSGGYKSKALFLSELRQEERHWGSYGITSNLGIVGTVNMDESTHGFSKKVLDRAFTIELSEVDLTLRPNPVVTAPPEQWPLERWQPRAIRLGELTGLSTKEMDLVDKTIRVLTEINKILIQAQLQVGFRTRDEVALFLLNAEEHRNSFVTSKGAQVDPLDLALMMKILPRIVGGSAPVRSAVLGLLGWAVNGQSMDSEQDADPILGVWKSSGQSGALPDAKFPRTAARLCLMLDRLRNDGFTSFWL